MRCFALTSLLWCALASAGTAELSWTAPTQNVDGSAYTNPGGYRVYRRCDVEPLAQIADVPHTQLAYTDTLPDDGRTCWWSLTAYNTLAEESARTNEVSKAFPASVEIPGSVSATFAWQIQTESPMAAEYNASGATGSASAASSLTLSSFSAAAGSNRLLEVWVLTSSGSPAAPTGVTWGGVSLTKRGSDYSFDTYWIFNKWYLKEASFPSGATGDIVVTWAGSHDERSVTALVTQNIDQTTTWRNASITTDYAASNTTNAVDVASTADDLVTGGIGIQAVAPVLTGVTINQGTEGASSDVGSLVGYHGLSAAYRLATTTTTALQATRVGGSSTHGMYWLADALIPSSGGAAASLTPINRSSRMAAMIAH